VSVLGTPRSARQAKSRSFTTMPITLIQLGLVDRIALARARMLAGGEPALVDALRETTLAQLGIEPAILSTCERLELYAVVPHALRSAASEVAARFAAIAGSDSVERRIGAAAVTHLFSVAAGLESRLIGEPHILGQVSRCTPAMQLADEGQRAHRAEGAGIIVRLVQDAVACGRAARAVSGLDRLSVSCVDLAIARAREAFTPGAKAGLIGSGTLARELAPRLVDAGFRLTVFSRHTPRPTDAAFRGLAWAPLASLHDHTASLSLLIAATSATTPVVVASDIGPRDHLLDIVDLGMPANISADLMGTPLVRIATLETLLADRRSPQETVESARVVVQARALRWSRRWLIAGEAHSTVLHSRLYGPRTHRP
jgi:glutamyl-tRNA reductase